MADTVIAASLQVDGNQASQEVKQVNKNIVDAGASVKSFRQQIKDAREELTGAIQQYGQFSQQAQDAAKKLGELQNTARDAQETAAKFATDGSAGLAAFSGAVRGVAAGFAAMQGAMALFGSESEDVQKTLLKVQAALALSEGLNNIGELQKSFQQLYTIIKDSTVVQGIYNFVMQGTVVATEEAEVATISLAAAMRGLLIATGIGAVVVGIIALVSALNQADDSSEQLKKHTEDLKDITKQGAQAYQDAYVQVANLKNEFAAAGTNSAKQKAALEDFNKTVGESTKQQTNFNDAQAWLADDTNTQNYIRAALARATANAAIGKAAEANFEMQQKLQDIDKQFGQLKQGTDYSKLTNDAINFIKSGGDLQSATAWLDQAFVKAVSAGDGQAKAIISDIELATRYIKESQNTISDFNNITSDNLAQYNSIITEKGWSKQIITDADAAKKTLDDLLKNQMDSLAAMQKAAEHDAEVNQSNEAEKTNIQVIAQEARIELLKSHLAQAAKIGGDYYTNYLQQEKQAELDLLALKDNYNKQVETQADNANAAELARAAKFKDNLKLVWTTGANAGQDITQPIGADNGPLKGLSLSDASKQSDNSPAVQQYQKYQEALKNLNGLAIDDNDQTKSGIAAFALNLKNRLDMLHDYYDKAIQAAREAGASQEEIEKISGQARMNIALSTASAIAGGAAQILGQQTAAGKAFAIVQTTIDTFQSAQSAYKAMAGIPIVGPALGAAAAAAAVIAGLANVKKIVSVQVPGQGSTGSAPSVSVAAPLTPAITPQATSTQLNADQLNQIGNAAAGGVARAYVLDSDVQNNRDRDARLNRAARLGG